MRNLILNRFWKLKIIIELYRFSNVPYPNVWRERRKPATAANCLLIYIKCSYNKVLSSIPTHISILIYTYNSLIYPEEHTLSNTYLSRRRKEQRII
jgi:hypothetical protein